MKCVSIKGTLIDWIFTFYWLNLCRYSFLPKIAAKRSSLVATPLSLENRFFAESRRSKKDCSRILHNFTVDSAVLVGEFGSAIAKLYLLTQPNLLWSFGKLCTVTLTHVEWSLSIDKVYNDEPCHSNPMALFKEGFFQGPYSSQTYLYIFL